MHNFSSLQDKIINAKELDFGDILSMCFELFKKTWLQGFILLLIIFIVVIPIFIAIYIPIYSSIIEQVQNGDYDPNDAANVLLQTDSFRYKILGLTFVMGLLTTTLVAGFYRIIKKIDLGDVFSASDFFYFFKGKYMGKIFAIAAFSFLVSLINFAFEKFLPPSMATLLSVILAISFSVYSTMFVLFFAFNPNLESNEIFSLSFNLGSRKWPLIFGLMFVTLIIGCFGFILCFIGILFTISIIYLPPYLIYKEIIGFNEKSDIEKIGETENL